MDYDPDMVRGEYIPKEYFHLYKKNDNNINNIKESTVNNDSILPLLETNDLMMSVSNKTFSNIFTTDMDTSMPQENIYIGDIPNNAIDIIKNQEDDSTSDNKTYKKKIYYNYKFIIIILMFVINCIGLPIIVISDVCESFRLDYINTIICITYAIYTFLNLLIIIFQKKKLNDTIHKTIIIIVIFIQMVIISISSMVLSIEIFDTNEQCNKISKLSIIIISIINLIWSLSKTVIMICTILFSKKNIINILNTDHIIKVLIYISIYVLIFDDKRIKTDICIDFTSHTIVIFLYLII
ncbi:unknown similar to AMEV165 [Choristoneura biennis entomopoxvirus]|uniref:Uncharacterized protein n=1 Tax=Choristoneura biennis entomopoxvirus TaxID=10288 RepID=A0A916KPP2_CBEPV|nr:unknown similar to AMEV165 [Choristoneura biennis entomopoxvirus]CCU55775.1 unknown similar to AMEV165 [Choristoneura biennis entomopoxvirus]